MGDLDIAAKVLLRLEPEALLALGFPGLRIRSVAPDEVELAPIARRMDEFS